MLLKVPRHSEIHLCLPPPAGCLLGLVTIRVCGGTRVAWGRFTVSHRVGVSDCFVKRRWWLSLQGRWGCVPLSQSYTLSLSQILLFCISKVRDTWYIFSYSVYRMNSKLITTVYYSVFLSNYVQGEAPQNRIIYWRVGSLYYRLLPLGECSRNPSISVYQLTLLWEAAFSFSEIVLKTFF